MVMYAQQKDIFLLNAWTVEQELRYRSPANEGWILWSGEPVVGWISATPTGLPLTGLGPTNMLEESEGVYRCTFSSLAIDTALTVYLGQFVYQVVQAGPNDEYTAVTPLLVKQPRYVG